MEEEKQKLFLVKKTQLEMILDRGYNLSSIEEKILKNDYNYFSSFVQEKRKEKQQTIRSILSTIYEKNKQRLFVYYVTKPRDKKKISGLSVENFYNYMAKYQIDKGIMIYNGELSTSAKNELLFERRINGNIVDVQVFRETELYCNPVKHILTPRHVLLSEVEKQNLLNEMKLPSLSMLPLPIIFTTDPVVKYYNWEAGSLIKIYRNDDIGVLTPETIAYRIIIKATVEN